MTTSTLPARSPFDWSELIEPDLPSPLELFLDLPVGDNGERWELAQSPWVEAVLEWWLDPAVEWIYLVQGSQTSKTTTEMGLLLYAAKFDPGPTMWVGAIEEEVDKFVVQRLKPFLEAASPQSRTKRKVDWRRADLRLFGKMLVHFAWATSGKKIRSWPCRYTFGDECGIWPATLQEVGDPLEYTKKRTRRYSKRKGVFATTPSSEHHPSWIAAKTANFARWHVPCPECGEYQYLSWHRIKFAHCQSADTWDLERVAHETYYACEFCGAQITDRDKPDMIAAGRLVYVDPDSGEPIEPNQGNKSRTLQVPGTYSLFTPWGSLARMFIEAKMKGPDSLRIFVTDELAEPWRESVEAPTEHALAACIDRERAPGSVPEGALRLTAGVDVQKDHLYYVVRAWGYDGRSWLVKHGILPRELDGGLDILDDVLLDDYDGKKIAFTFIDSGYEPDFVYAYCRQTPKTSPSKGAAGEMAELVKPSPLERHKGKPVAGTLHLFMINTAHWKGLIHERIKVKRGDPREWRLHGETDEAYMKQILSEARVEKTKRGQTVREWVVIDKASGNHYLDCEVLAAAAAWFPLRVHRIRRKTSAATTKSTRPMKQGRPIKPRPLRTKY